MKFYTIEDLESAIKTIKEFSKITGKKYKFNLDLDELAQSGDISNPINDNPITIYPNTSYPNTVWYRYTTQTTNDFKIDNSNKIEPDNITRSFTVQ